MTNHHSDTLLSFFARLFPHQNEQARQQAQIWQRERTTTSTLVLEIHPVSELNNYVPGQFVQAYHRNYQKQLAQICQPQIVYKSSPATQIHASVTQPLQTEKQMITPERRKELFSNVPTTHYIDDDDESTIERPKIMKTTGSLALITRDMRAVSMLEVLAAGDRQTGEQEPVKPGNWLL